MYAVIDTASRNIMGEFETFAQAEVMLIELVGAHPEAATEIVIVSDTGETQPVDRERLREAAWGHTHTAVSA